MQFASIRIITDDLDRLVSFFEQPGSAFTPVVDTYPLSRWGYP